MSVKLKNRVLVIDDDQILLRVLKSWLRSAGFVPYVAESYKDGERILNEILPDIIIIDLSVPDMHGNDFLVKVRKDPVFNQVPIIVITGNGDEAVVIASFENGADDFINKPFSQENFITRIKARLRRRPIGLPFGS